MSRLYTLLFFLFPAFLISQEITLESQWIYRQDLWLPPDVTSYVISVIGDTIINGEKAFKLDEGGWNCPGD